MALGITDAIDLTSRIAELVKKGATLEAQERIMDLREALLNAKDDLLRVREDNQQLRVRVAEQEEWQGRAGRYALAQTNGGAVVYVSQEPFAHYSCPSCFEKRQIHILQDLRSMSGRFACPGCGKAFPVNPVELAEGELPDPE